MKKYTKIELEGMSKDELIEHAKDVRDHLDEIIRIYHIKES